MGLAEDIMAYQPVNEQEHVDRELILGRLAHDPHVADRSSLAHLTTSAWTVDAAGERVLLCYHNIYDSWSWVGGHADGERDLARAVLAVKGKYGKNALVKGLSFTTGATARERNDQVGGHRA